MAEEANAAEGAVETPPEVNKEEASLPTQVEVDYAAALTEKDNELERVRKERDNYKKGLLRAKGKQVEQTFPEEEPDLEAKIASIVEERLMTSREAQLQIEKDNLIKKALKENSELKAALKNRNGMVSAAGSSSEESAVPNELSKIFSKEQIEDLKSRGLDPTKVAENMKRASGT